MALFGHFHQSVATALAEAVTPVMVERIVLTGAGGIAQSGQGAVAA